MREIYMDKSEIKLKFNPKNSECLTELTHPEMLLNSSMKFHKYPKEYENYPGSTISAVECNILLTNELHDGIWLLSNPEENKVSIPGGNLGETELSYIAEEFPYSAIYRCIIRNLMESNRSLRGSHIDEMSNAKSNLAFLLRQYGFTITDAEFPLFYSYRDYDGVFSIYLIKEATSPDCVIPPFYVKMNRNMIWYGRKEHSLNQRTSKNRRELFNTNYKYDIRVVTKGIAVLDKVLRTETIFGKIDIY